MIDILVFFQFLPDVRISSECLCNVYSVNVYPCKREESLYERSLSPNNSYILVSAPALHVMVEDVSWSDGICRYSNHHKYYLSFCVIII